MLIPCSSGGGTEETLIWTNPSPSANFDAQTISLDLSEYTSVRIEGWRESDGRYYFSQILPIGKATGITIFFPVVASNNVGIYASLRTVTTTSSSIEFSHSMRWSQSGSAVAEGANIGDLWDKVTVTLNNSLVIPQKIYGIK